MNLRVERCDMESTKNTAMTSPALARLYRAYKWYVVEAISETEPILSVEEFYFKQLRNREIKKSRIFEKYLCDLTKKGLTNELR